MAVTKVFDREGIQAVDASDPDIDFMSNRSESFLSEEMYNSSMGGDISPFINTTIPMEELSTKETEFDYSGIFISSSAELVGTTMVILLVDRAGRIPSQLVCYTAAGICIFLLTFLASMTTSTGNRLELIALGFILRAFEMAGTATSWVATAELLTTEIRASGHSSANAMARLGAFFCPFVISDMSMKTIGVTLMFVHFFTAGCIFKLPETKGMSMGGAGGGHYHESAGPIPDDNGDGLFVIGDGGDGQEQIDAATDETSTVENEAHISAGSEKQKVSERSENLELT
jgi:hypothetical protein